MRLLGQDGKPVDVPDDQVQAAFQSGKFLLPKGSLVPMRTANGQLGRVPAEQAQAALESGASIIPESTIHEADLQAKYGSAGGMARTALEGAGRGLTLGASDYAQIEVEREQHGDLAAEALRRDLEGRREANPFTAGASEIAGAAAPVLATGGAGAAVEGAEAARAAASVADAARAAEEVSSVARPTVRGALEALGAPNVGISKAGDLAARATRAVVGTGEGANLGAFGTKLAEHAVRGVVEGGLYGAANEVDESVLGDHELNAEKMLAAAGYGALLGGTVGGALTAGGELSRNVVGRVAPRLQGAAEEQAWRSLSPLKKFTEEAKGRVPGGTKAVGRVLLDEGVIPESIAGATPDELLPRVQAAKQRVGADLSDRMASTGATVKVDDVLAHVDDVIRPLEKKAGFESIVNSLKTYRASLLDKMAPMLEREGAPATKTIEKELTQPEVIDLMNQAKGNLTPEFMAENRLTARNGKLFQSVDEVVHPEKQLARPVEVPVQALFEQRKALDDLVYREVRSLDPNMRVGFLRDIRGKLANMEVEAIDAAEKQAGRTGAGDELRALRRKYQALSIAEDAAETSSSRMATNRNVSLSGYVTGAAASAATGHLGLGAVAAIGHQVLKEHGNAAAAFALNKIASLGAIQRAASTVDTQMARGIAGFLKPGERAPMRVKPPAFEGAAAPSSFHAKHKAVTTAAVQADAHADAAARAVADIAPHAPQTATSFQQKAITATAFLASKLPQTGRHIAGVQPHMGELRVSDYEAARFERYVDTVHDPLKVLDDMAKGHVSADQIEALKAVYPKLYDELSSKLQERLATHPEKVPYEKAVQIGVLLGFPADDTMRPDFVAAMQSNFQSPQSHEPGGPGGQQRMPGAPKRMLSHAAEASGLSSMQTPR